MDMAVERGVFAPALGKWSSATQHCEWLAKDLRNAAPAALTRYLVNLQVSPVAQTGKTSSTLGH